MRRLGVGNGDLEGLLGGTAGRGEEHNVLRQARLLSTLTHAAAAAAAALLTVHAQRKRFFRAFSTIQTVPKRSCSICMHVIL